ncbi:hypothetical protein A2276_01005 [candidate division WOR-1 bacterium RIFOXYA12_FULL_43_27]|uniref:Uncharacterized protein n=1 Tax=candidate division WOR-1 bacterium RIFOXYC2_FULL_46_14 TaxID=1802587 RepID=A0A1F4U4P7_UNCSA|nr:MAG: hypothetical protein A2276_01005 [candidate division WOR-1 bacterium RIFOXYA12_FULL_43_27]OGC20736.1 MAG: hypothetical protein A2292_06870 [candidate division WOR-1 bacterium RIFOXYB2_FULL_46_45]OGC31527.1 MAG: hypothetical protein A2232_04580 [candidate division WOR-1 bacterium RIFOXYA2_FULL_46_56]OGC39934.1 MAG: hypothetical protein A2438_05420 [candidate division WOR-1 bacterium RIFOXYC2_FULL_46_14]
MKRKIEIKIKIIKFFIMQKVYHSIFVSAIIINMKKKLLIVLASFILFAATVAFALPMLIPTKAVKDFAARQIGSALNRTVSIEGVSINLFEGIRLKGIYIGNRKGFSNKPFIAAKSLNLRYSFWPLFVRKVVIYEITLNTPTILIEKNAKGEMNLEGIGHQEISKSVGRKSEKQDIRKTEKQKTSPVDLFVNNINIKNGQFLYHDYLTGISGVKNLNVKVSGVGLSLIKPIEIKASASAVYLKETIPLSLSAKVEIDPSFSKFKISPFSMQIAGESFSCPIEYKSDKKKQEVSFALSSQNLSIDTLLGIFAAQSVTPSAKPKPGALTQSIKNSAKGIPDNLSVKGSFDLSNAVFQKLKLSRFNAILSLSGKKVFLKLKEVSGYNGTLSGSGQINLAALTYSVKPLVLKNFEAGTFLDDLIDSFAPALLNLKGKTEGSLDVSLSLTGSGVEMPEAFNKAKIDGVVVLTNGRLKKIKTLEEIGNRFGLSMLKNDILVKGLRLEAGLLNKVLNVKKLELRDTDLEVVFWGGLDFNNMKYKEGNRLTLKLSPAATAGLPPEFAILKDERGYTAADFELQGSLYAPIPAPRLDKPIEKAIGNLKIKIEAQKIELEESVKKQAEEKLKKILKF